MRIALTQTLCSYPAMPDRIENLEETSLPLDCIRQANIDHHLELISAANNCDVDLICLGELFPWPYFPLHKSPVWLHAAEDIHNSPSLKAIQKAAAQYQLHIIAPIYELDPLTGNRYNTAVYVNHQGEMLGKYRKTHIPEGRNEQAGFYEKFYFEPNNGKQNNHSPHNISCSPYFPVIATEKANIGLMICYDRHFKEVITTLVDQGAEVIFCPSASFGQVSKKLWDVDFISDALKYRVFIGGNNRCGAELPWNVEFFGSSYFAGPEGRLEDQCDHPNLYVADLNLDLVRGSHPAGWNIIRDRRKNIY